MALEQRGKDGYAAAIYLEVVVELSGKEVGGSTGHNH